jgi:phage/plasmid-associated DNA primase
VNSLLSKDTMTTRMNHFCFALNIKVPDESILNEKIHKAYDHILKNPSKPCYEFLQDDQKMVKPYFDVDLLEDSKPTKEDVDTTITRFKNVIIQLFDIKDENDIFIAGSIRPKNKQYKLSIHFIVDKHTITRIHLSRVKNQLKDAGFDPAIYSQTKQKFRCIGVPKDNEKEASILFPYENGNFKTSFSLEDFQTSCIQYIQNDFIHINDACIENTLNGEPQLTNVLHLQKIIGDEDVINLPIKLETNNNNPILTFNDNAKIQLVDLIDIKYIDNYDTWTRIIWAMREEGYTEHEAMIVSKKSHNYSQEGFNSLWRRPFDKSPVTLGTLRYYAKLSNPEKYNELICDLKQSQGMSYILRTCKGTHGEMSKILYYLYKDKYVCVDMKNQWYYFNGSHWKNDIEAHMFTTDIESLYHLFERETSKIDFDTPLEKMDNNSESNVTKKTVDNQKNKIQKIAFNLQTHSYSQGVFHCSKKVFFQENFIQKLDNDPYLLGFNNGVFDLKNKQFRKGIPEDLVSLSVGYDYCNFTDTKIADFVKTFVTQIYPNEDVRNYTLKTFARQLIGDQCRNLFHIHSGKAGSASNGKSTFFEILSKVLGTDYVTKFDIKELTCGKKNSTGSSAEPLKATWKSKRILYASEPDKSSQLQSAILKDLTSGESINYRLNFSNTYVSYKPCFKVHIMCNSKPHIEAEDQGIKRRIRNIEYLSEFVDDSLVNEEEHHYRIIDNIDGFFEKDEYKLAFFKLLIENLDVEWSFTPPKCVHEATQTYFNDCNYLQQFCDEYLENTQDEKAGLSLKQIKDVIKKSQYKHDIHTGHSLKDELFRVLNTDCQSEGQIRGVRMKNIFRCWVFRSEPSDRVHAQTDETIYF